MTQRAWIRVTPELVAQLLGLPYGAQIVRADFHSWDFTLRFGIEGGDLGLPDQDPGQMTPEIGLVFRAERNGEMERIFAHFTHAPETEWFVIERRALIIEQRREPTAA